MAHDFHLTPTDTTRFECGQQDVEYESARWCGRNDGHTTWLDFFAAASGFDFCQAAGRAIPGSWPKEFHGQAVGTSVGTAFGQAISGLALMCDALDAINIEWCAVS